MEDWKEYKIDDLCGFQNGFAFKSSDFCSDGKYRVVKIKELKAGQVKFFEDSSFVNCLDSSVIDKYSIKKNDVLFALTGDPVNKPNPQSWVGRVSIYNQEEESLLNQRVCKAMPKEGLDSFFLYYYFRQNDVFYALASKATGSASQANISTKTIGDIHIRIPSLIEQKRIVNILKSLDDKIECNRRINENLEQQAQALFKSWFVDFEPFKDQPFVESELGMIPQGWRVGRLCEIAEVIMGASPSGSSYNNEGKGDVFYQGRAEFDFRYPKRNLFTTEAKRFADVDSILVSVRAPVGDINVAEERCCIGRGLASVKSNKGCNSFMLYLMQSLKPVFERFNGEGTVFGSINKKSFEDLKIVIPDEKNILDFDSISRPIDLKIRNTTQESRRLAELRDALLPKLMSGEINVNEVKI